MDYQDTNICDSCGDTIDKSKDIYLNTNCGRRLCSYCSTDLLQVLINKRPDINDTIKQILDEGELKKAARKSQ